MLSTCNRTEVYAVAERFHGAYADIRDFLCELGVAARPTSCTRTSTASTTRPPPGTSSRSPPGSTRPCSARARSSARCAPRGEVAQDEGGAALDAQPAVPPRPRAGKRARTETASAAARRRSATPPSRWPPTASARLAGRECSSSAPARWATASPPRCTGPAPARSPCANRTPQRGAALAGARRRRRPSGFDRLGDGASPRPTSSSPAPASGQSVVTRRDCSRPHERAGAPAAHRRHRRAARRRPRASPSVDGVTLLDLDDLRDWADRGTRACAPARPTRVRAIVGEEVERFVVEVDGPPGRAARRPAARARPRQSAPPSSTASPAASPSSTTTQRDAVEALTRAIVAKLLHEPSVRLRHDAGTPQGERNAAAVRDLFDLH